MLFKSSTYGMCTLEQTIQHITNKISSNANSEWVLAVGTDSQNKGASTKFCQVILLHEKGKGGIFFYSVNKAKRIEITKLRMLEEARESIDLVKSVLNILEEMFYEETFDYTEYDIKIEIHCDLGYRGKSSEAISDTIGWIVAEFGDTVTPKIKPDSMAASSIADIHTK